MVLNSENTYSTTKIDCKLVIHVSLCLTGCLFSAIGCLVLSFVASWKLIFQLWVGLCPLHQSVEKRKWYRCELINPHALWTHVETISD
jgi:hypothetical protein